MDNALITLTEAEIILLIKQKNREAFNFLYENYSTTLYKVIRSMLADEHICQDVLQEVFLKIWQKIDQFDPVKGKLYTWMLNLTKHTTIDKIRTKEERIKRYSIEKESCDRFDSEPSTDKIGLVNLVNQLKKEHQTLIKLRYFGGYTMAETSDYLNIPLGTVKTNMRKALTQLRTFYAFEQSVTSY